MEAMDNFFEDTDNMDISSIATQRLEEEIKKSGLSGPCDVNWDVYYRFLKCVDEFYQSRFSENRFLYIHPTWLQHKTPERFRKFYQTPLFYTCWGDRSQSSIICLGGIVNTARRFDYVAQALSGDHCVICMDWAGRGQSGWLAEQTDYSFDSHVQQVWGLIRHLQIEKTTIIGSSLGGSVGMRLAAQYPDLVERLILNDVGPFIPLERRRRRAQTVARHYVFQQPVDLFRQSGGAQKNDGPIGDAVLLHTNFHQTQWSESHQGRVYRHDLRAMQAYQEWAKFDHVQWADWEKVQSPTLLIHGVNSDALNVGVIEQMKRSSKELAVMHVPDTGHTPVLSEKYQHDLIKSWIRGEWPSSEEVYCPRIPFPKRKLFCVSSFSPAKSLSEENINFSR
ncbi:Pimeloyl-ACP methyl ester carboxylesterase [Azospirillaceae bacterium]